MKHLQRSLATLFASFLIACLMSSTTASAQSALSKNLEWAPTGHMTTDGQLEAGCHPQLYGLDVDYLDINANNSYVYALMALVSHLQRGEISKGQMKWLYERAIMSAVPRNYIEEFMAFDHRKAELGQYMISSGGDSIARVLFYDVTQMIAYGDRYDRRRRSGTAYRKIYSDAAKILEISPNISRSITSIVKYEVRLLDRKTRVFWGETPYIPPAN